MAGHNAPKLPRSWATWFPTGLGVQVTSARWTAVPAPFLEEISISAKLCAVRDGLGVSMSETEGRDPLLVAQAQTVNELEVVDIASQFRRDERG